jgi:hypothetical protein
MSGFTILLTIFVSFLIGGALNYIVNKFEGDEETI